MHNKNCNIVRDLTSIIIVNYNTGNYLRKCLESIYKFENPDIFQIIVVDNASTDNTEDIIDSFMQKHNNIYFIKSNINHGFSKANNIGFKDSDGEFILILNPDIEFQSQLLSRLKKHLERKESGAVSPFLKGIKGEVQYNYYQKYPTIRQFIYFHSLISKIFSGNVKLRNKYLHKADFGKNQQNLVQVHQLPCAFLLTRRDIFSEAGLMNDKFFLFFEDVDLSFRISRKYDLYVDTAESVLHYGGSSFNIDKNPEIYGKYILSMNIFFDLNYSSVRAFLLKFFTVVNSLLIISIEYFNRLFGSSDSFRAEKHKYFLKLFKNHYY